MNTLYGYSYTDRNSARTTYYHENCAYVAVPLPPGFRFTTFAARAREQGHCFIGQRGTLEPLTEPGTTAHICAYCGAQVAPPEQQRPKLLWLPDDEGGLRAYVAHDRYLVYATIERDYDYEPDTEAADYGDPSIMYYTVTARVLLYGIEVGYSAVHGVGVTSEDDPYLRHEAPWQELDEALARVGEGLGQAIGNLRTQCGDLLWKIRMLEAEEACIREQEEDQQRPAAPTLS